MHLDLIPGSPGSPFLSTWGAVSLEKNFKRIVYESFLAMLHSSCNQPILYHCRQTHSSLYLQLISR